MLSATSGHSQRLTPLHLLKLRCSTEGKSTPDHYGAPSFVGRRKHLRWDLLVMLVTLETIRTIKVTFVLIREQNFLVSLQSRCSIVNNYRRLGGTIVLAELLCVLQSAHFRHDISTVICKCTWGRKLKVL